MELILRENFIHLLSQIASLDTELILLVILCAITLIVWDSLELGARKKKKETGIKLNSVTVSIDGSKTLPVRNYVSDIQGLAGKPDAIIVEDGFVIPIERKPLARKLRDRYIAQLLVYMRLVEEFEGKRPPYGYLILGSKCRRFKIWNSEERQRWLQKQIDEMREILDGKDARPSPHPRKCRKCTVRQACSFSADIEKPDEIVQIEKKEVA